MSGALPKMAAIPAARNAVVGAIVDLARGRSRLICCGWLVAATLLQGCASTPSLHPTSPGAAITMPAPGAIEAPMPSPEGEVDLSLGSEVAIRAISLLGAPYKFGGSGPKAFDCSGLVQFVYDEIGIDVPRTAAEQFRSVAPVKLAELEPGDLVFFKTHGSRVSHVGIYTGSNRFVHAPQTGRPIELRDMDDQYYRRRFVGAGRVLDGTVQIVGTAER
jgi:cell wall-associated NlpC family hydrolase